MGKDGWRVISDELAEPADAELIPMGKVVDS